ncbi:MAG: hypothetical protein OES78_10040, partial [Chromatiales bacterium]|nr:hypothetical protein [Chromatiales bacterium]
MPVPGAPIKLPSGGCPDIASEYPPVLILKNSWEAIKEKIKTVKTISNDNVIRIDIKCRSGDADRSGETCG